MTDPLAAPGPRVHLCLVEPVGYLHSGALLDPLIFFEAQFTRSGAVVSSAKNTLLPDAVNFVFGAHLGFERALLDEFDCVLVNLEQLGPGGADLHESYVELLSGASVVDYHPENTRVYGGGPGRARLVRLGHASYLQQHTPGWHERDIDLLFVGCLTPRRLSVIKEFESFGQEVTILTRPVYGPARDDLVRRSRAVLNISAYATNRFEQVRASVVLSCGTPLVSESRPWTSGADRRFIPFVHWFDPERPGDFFRDTLNSSHFEERSAAMLEQWRREDVLEDFAALLGT